MLQDQPHLPTHRGITILAGPSTFDSLPSSFGSRETFQAFGMTIPQHQRIRELFRLIAVEKDPERVQALAGELGRLLMIQAPLPEPSGQQLRIIELVARGFNNREIAENLGMSSNVIRNYISKIYDTFSVNNRVQLALWYEARVHEQKLLRPSN